MTDQNRVKLSRDDDDETHERCIKAKRHDAQIPMADVDIKLAEKLDNLLKISNSSKPKFLTNKPRASRTSSEGDSVDATSKGLVAYQTLLKPRNLTKEELRERIIKRYDTLVPELDPKRPNVRVVKILSASESIELGKDQARKQMERQMELNSVSGNQQAHKACFKAFKFNDGYEKPMPSRNSKSVRFSNKVNTESEETEYIDDADEDKDAEDDDDSDDSDDNDATESDSTTNEE